MIFRAGWSASLGPARPVTALIVTSLLVFGWQPEALVLLWSYVRGHCCPCHDLSGHPGHVESMSHTEHSSRGGDLRFFDFAAVECHGWLCFSIPSWKNAETARTNRLSMLRLRFGRLRRLVPSLFTLLPTHRQDSRLPVASSTTSSCSCTWGFMSHQSL